MSKPGHGKGQRPDLAVCMRAHAQVVLSVAKTHHNVEEETEVRIAGKVRELLEEEAAQERAKQQQQSPLQPPQQDAAAAAQDAPADAAAATPAAAAAAGASRPSALAAAAAASREAVAALAQAGGADSGSELAAAEHIAGAPRLLQLPRLES